MPTPLHWMKRIRVMALSSSAASQTETCYLFYGPKNSTLSPHLHGTLVRGWGQKLKEDIAGIPPLCSFNHCNGFILYIGRCKTQMQQRERFNAKNRKERNTLWDVYYGAREEACTKSRIATNWKLQGPPTKNFQNTYNRCLYMILYIYIRKCLKAHTLCADFGLNAHSLGNSGYDLVCVHCKSLFGFLNVQKTGFRSQVC